MSWEFSPSADVLQVIEILLWDKPKYWLVDALMSYKDYHQPKMLRNKPPFRYIFESPMCSKESLIYAILEAIEDTRTCSNGGFDVYIDSQGWYSIRLSDYDKLSPDKLDRLTTYAGYDSHSIPPQQLPFYDD